MSEDRFRYDDAAYVLGALPADDRVAFERHLAECPECRAQVAEVEDLPAVLSQLSAEDVAELDPRRATDGAPAEPPVRSAGLPGHDAPVPETLLPGLLRRAAVRRRRQRGVLAGLVAAVAAAAVALVVVLWPAGSGSTPAPAAERAFSALRPSPVQASAVLVDKPWGTAIDLRCVYQDGRVEHTYGYRLWVYGRDGSRQDAGSWLLPPDRDIRFSAGTALRRNQIARLEIALPNGPAILRLTT